MYDLWRIERWPNGMHCIFCTSSKVTKIGNFMHKNKYLCEDCNEEFFDDSQTSIEPDRIKIAIMLHLLLNNRDQSEVIKFLMETYGFRSEYLKTLISEIHSETLLGDHSTLKFINFQHINSCTITEFRKKLTYGILQDAVLKHKSRSKNNNTQRS